MLEIFSHCCVDIILSAKNFNDIFLNQEVVYFFHNFFSLQFFTILLSSNSSNYLKALLNPAGPELSHSKMKAKFRNANSVVTQ